jgi:hypothetical protein
MKTPEQKLYAKQYNAKRYKRSRTLVRQAKNRPCEDCDIQYPSYVMEFDHVRGVKKFSLGFHGRQRVDAVIEEIAKCDVVCSNCHAARTYIRRRFGITETTH